MLAPDMLLRRVTIAWNTLSLVASGSWTIFGLTMKLTWLMPAVVDGYLVAALILWMAPVPAHIAAFARKNTYGSAAVGVLAQAAYHALLIWSTTGVLWRAVLACLVGSLPPLFAGLAVHMRALVRREGRNLRVPEAPEAPVAPVKPEPPQVPPTRFIAAPVPPANGHRAEPEQKVRESDTPEPVPAEPESEETAVARTRRYPTSAYPTVPVPAPKPQSEPPATTVRRPPEVTRKLATEIWEKEPGLTRLEVAHRLKISDRQLRYVLNAAT